MPHYMMDDSLAHKERMREDVKMKHGKQNNLLEPIQQVFEESGTYQDQRNPNQECQQPKPLD